MRRITISAPILMGVALILTIVALGPRTGATPPVRNSASSGTNCAGTVWGSNASEQSISVIDDSTNTIVHTTSIGVFGFGLAFSADGTRASTFSYAQPNPIVTVLDGATGSIHSVIDLGPAQDVNFATISADGTKVFVLRDGAPASIEAWSVATGSRVQGPVSLAGSNPYALLAAPNGNDLYLTMYDGSYAALHRLDATTLASVTTISPPGTEVTFDGFSITRDSSTVWWQDVNTLAVYRYDVASATSSPVFDANPLQTYSLDVSPDGHTVALWGSFSVWLLDTTTMTVGPAITPPGVYSLRKGGFTADSSRLYMVDFDYASTVMMEIDVVTNAVLSTFMSGGETIVAATCPVGFEPPPTTTTTTAPDPVVPKVTG